MQIKDRIKEFKRIRASELMPHPQNWRSHPQAQREALQGILADVGYVDALMVRPYQGGYQILDGHLRAETTPDTEVPVLVVDLDDAEAKKVLASFDPLAAMAEADAGKLDELLREVETGSEALSQMLADLAKDAGCEYMADDDSSQMTNGDDSMFGIVVTCDTEQQQIALLKQFEMEGLRCRALIY